VQGETKMKKITILGEEFEYERKVSISFYGDAVGFYTQFYQGTEEVTVTTWVFWKDSLTVPKKVFIVDFWIEEADHYTKEELRALLERKVKLLHRKRELERGELI
jgi:hypothetical protein